MTELQPPPLQQLQPH